MKHLLPLLFLFMLASCGKHDAINSAATALPSIAVKVQSAKLESHVAVEEVVGTVRSKLRAMVKAGDLLARLDVQEIQAKVDQAKAMRSSA